MSGSNVLGRAHPASLLFACCSLHAGQLTSPMLKQNSVEQRSPEQLLVMRQVQYADGDSDQLLLAMERVRLLMVPGQPLPQPSAAELQTLADTLRARADQVDARVESANGERHR